MAKSKASAPAPVSSIAGSHVYVFALIFLALSVFAAWQMRISPVLNDIPKDMEKTIKVGKLQHGFVLRKQYTTIPPVDEFLSMLVTAFIAGPASFDYSVHLHQFHFLVGFFPILCVWTAEACRERTKWTPLCLYDVECSQRFFSDFSSTSIWACLYQTVGGAVIVPLHDLCYVFYSQRPSYYTTDRAVRLPIAQALVPALVLGFLAPTVMMYIPGIFTKDQLMIWIAVWQFTPLVVNLLLFLFTGLTSLGGSMVTSSIPTSKPSTKDVPYLTTVYCIGLIASAAAHLFVLYEIFTTPSLSFASVFIPDIDKARSSMTQGFHYIFQWDWIIIAVSQLMWAFLNIAQLKMLGVKTPGVAYEILFTTALVVFLGPGGALAFIWWWREDRMVELEQAKSGKAKKSQ